LFAGDEFSPEFVVSAADELEALLDSLDGEQRGIAILKMDGLRNSEIAETLGISLRSVERKLPLIDKKWRQRLNDNRSV
jgi:DNA-directed RNA polymerase specialized sigma24 family protein